MEKGFIRRAMAAHNKGNSTEAIRIMNEGLDFYADYMQKITMGIETYDAAILLHVLRPLVAALENLPGVPQISTLIDQLTPLTVANIQVPVKEDKDGK